MNADLNALRKLSDGWDGEGAPRPSEEALQRAAAALADLQDSPFDVYDVDADVLGGVALWLNAPGRTRFAWIAIMNSGRATVVLTSRPGQDVRAIPWDGAAIGEMKRAAEDQ